MMSLTSSPSSGTGNVANGPMTELHEENVARVAVDLARLLVPGHRHHTVMGEREHGARGSQLLEVGVRILQE